MSDSPAILLVHGAWHGAWCWDSVVPLLEAHGLQVRTLDLPTVHSAGKAGLGLEDDAAAVRAAIDAIDGPVVVVAHSYGGVPVTQGAAGAANVTHIVYIAAFALDEGESLLGAVGGVAPSWWVIDGDVSTPGTPDEPASQLFFNDIPADEAAPLVAQLAAQAKRPFEEVLTQVAWRTIPSTYLVTERDSVFPLPAQEALAARAGAKPVRLDTGHSPFVSQPEATADIIAAAAGAA